MDVILAPLLACCTSSVMTNSRMNGVFAVEAQRYGGLPLPLVIGAVAALAWGHPRVAFWVGSFALSFLVTMGLFLTFAFSFGSRGGVADRAKIVALATTFMASPAVYGALSAYSVRNGLFVPIFMIALVSWVLSPRPATCPTPTPEPAHDGADDSSDDESDDEPDDEPEPLEPSTATPAPIVTLNRNMPA